MFDLTGQLAVVTGARRGIGLAFAEALARAGADIVGVSAAMEPGGSEVGRRVEACGRSFTGIATDFRDRGAVVALAGRLRELEVDVLVNNAGTIGRGPAAAHPDALWDEVLAVNLDAPFLLAREVGARMVERRRGKIIFTASVLSFQGGVNVPGYVRPSTRSRASRERWPTSGRLTASTSTRSPRATSRPTTRSR